MRTVIHVSDLHFGAADRAIVEALVTTINDLTPDAVAVSGDLTQRARRWQFREARAFLDRLPVPQIVVPGNHDVPLYNVLRRFGSPRGRFRSLITKDRRPYFSDGTMALMGVDSTRSFTIKDGGLRPRDVELVRAQLVALDPAIVKIVVCHHPFDAPAGRIGRWTWPPPAADAMTVLTMAGADMFLTGHLHVAYTGRTATRYKTERRAAIVVEAGTAVSTRVRGEANSFNLLHIEAEYVTVERLAWNGETRTFGVVDAAAFRRCAGGWAAEAQPTI
jgi:3',5'-cyclic AMP phosphodiesterase CpdA